MTNQEQIDAFLAHHGVKGMRWGVRKDRDASADRSNGQNTVSELKSQKVEEKAKVFEKRAKEFRRLAEVNQKRADTASWVNRGSYKKAAAENKKYAEIAEKDAQNLREGKLTSGQKQLLIGAAVVGTIVAAKGAQMYVQSGEFNRSRMRGESWLKGSKSPLFNKNEAFSDKSYTPQQIMDNVVSGINPDYGSWGTNMNCRRCTFAYELRRRGFDVRATRTSNGSGQTAVGLINALSPDDKIRSTGKIGSLKVAFKENSRLNEFTSDLAFPAGGKNIISGNTAKEIFARLNQEPNGSRGEFGVNWKTAMPGIPGGGHSMAYEIIKGKAHIFDAQTGERYTASHKVFKQIEKAGFTRLDNVELNLDYLSRWVKNSE